MQPATCYSWPQAIADLGKAAGHGLLPTSAAVAAYSRPSQAAYVSALVPLEVKQEGLSPAQPTEPVSSPSLRTIRSKYKGRCDRELSLNEGDTVRIGSVAQLGWSHVVRLGGDNATGTESGWVPEWLLTPPHSEIISE